MAILTGLPGTIAVGTTSGTITLSPTDLIAGMSITGPFATSTNWKLVSFIYQDATGVQHRSVNMPSIVGFTGNFTTSSTAYTNTWTCQSIVILDNDGGSYKINRATFPSPSAFDVVVANPVVLYNLRPSLATPFSISVWVNFTAVGSNQIFFVNRETSGNARGIMFFQNNANLVQLWLVNNTGQSVNGASTGGVSSTGSWHHIVATYDGLNTGGSIKFYIDGVAAGTAGGTLTDEIVPNAGFITMGYSALYGYDFTGNMDEFAFFQGTALSAGQVTSIYNSGTPATLVGLPNLAAWYRFGDTSTTGDSWTNGGGTLVDRSGNSHTGTHSGTSSGFSSSVPGAGSFSDRSAPFNGSDHITVA
jgi:hypothetical protein